MNAPRDARLGLGLALVLAMAGVFAGYYLVHKPLTPGQALAFAGTLGNLAVAALVTTLGGGLGRRALRWQLDLHPLAPGVGAVLAVALGWGLLGLGVLALGLARLLYAAVLWCGVLLLLIWLRRDVRAWAGEVAAAVRGLAPAAGPDRFAALFVAVVLSLGLLQAAAPPLKWDALVYHLALPKLYAQTHGLYIPLADFSLFTGMPQLGEMLYTAAHVLRLDPAAGSLAAQLLGWAGGALLALGLAAAAAEQGLPAWLAPAVLFSSISVAASLAWGYVELLMMLLALAMLLALREWRRGGQRSWLALAGFMGGLAFCCKYTGFIVPLGGLAVVAHTLWRCPEYRRARGGGLVPAGVFVLAAGVVAAPWLLKNWVFTGSPIYPLLIPAADMDAPRLWFYNRPDLTEGNVLRAALIFWRTAFLGVQGGNDFDVTLGPLLILLPVAVLAGWRWLRPAQRVPLAQWGLFAGVAYAAWVGLVLLSTLAEQARLFFAVLPALALLAAGGWAALRQLDTAALRISVVMGAGLALALGLSALELATQFVLQQPLPYVAGLQSRQDYEVARLGGYPLAMQQISRLPPGARVLFLWESRSLGCAASVTCVPDVIIDRWWHLRQSGATAASLVRAWQAAGVTHLLVYETGRAFVAAEAASPFQPADWVELEALRAALGAGQTIGDAYTLYALP